MYCFPLCVSLFVLFFLYLLLCSVLFLVLHVFGFFSVFVVSIVSFCYMLFTYCLTRLFGQLIVSNNKPSCAVTG